MKIIKNKNKYISFVQKQSYRFAVVLVVFSMFVNILNINQTSAYFNDEAIIEGTEFTAGTLEIDLDDTNLFSPDLMYPADSNSVSMDISNIGSLDSQYIAKTITTGSDNSACSYITMTATDGTSTYTGLIENFISVATPTTDTTWSFDFTVNADAPVSVWGKTCSFKWNYTAWQTDLADSSMGFTAVKEKLGEIKIGKAVVMNEIIPNPEGLDTQSGLQGEWVELYNNSNTSIELNGWKIKDLTGNIKIISASNTMNGRTLIGPKGSYLEWVVVFMNNDIMNNNCDTISFYDDKDNLVDQYKYKNSVNDTDSDSNSTGGADNDTPGGSETAHNEGKSHARIPDGTGEWIDPIPTPGTPNKLDEEIVPTETKELLDILQDENKITEEEEEEIIVENATPSEAVTDESQTGSTEEVITEETESDNVEEVEESDIPEEEPTDEPIVEEAKEEEFIDTEENEEVTIEEPVVEELEEIVTTEESPVQEIVEDVVEEQAEAVEVIETVVEVPPVVEPPVQVVE